MRFCPFKLVTRIVAFSRFVSSQALQVLPTSNVELIIFYRQSAIRMLSGIRQIIDNCSHFTEAAVRFYIGDENFLDGHEIYFPAIKCKRRAAVSFPQPLFARPPRRRHLCL